MTHHNPKLGWGPIAAAWLLLANIVVPLVWGDVYPFTSAPMFRDKPQACCNYRVYGPRGEQLSAEDWFCQRVYDGNPLGYGVGIQPPTVIEQTFGQIHTEEQVRACIERQLGRAEHAGLAYVLVEQDVIGALPNNPERVGVIETRSYRIARGSPAEG